MELITKSERKKILITCIVGTILEWYDFIAVNITAAIFGGTAPFVMTFIQNMSQNDLAPGFYLVGITLLSLACIIKLNHFSFYQITPMEAVKTNA